MGRFSISMLLFFAAAMTPASGADEEPRQVPLPIPDILEGPDIRLEIREGILELPFGSSQTLGFNGDYLGPTIRVRDGQALDIRVDNTLDENTTVHWHGLHVPAEFDGGPHQVIDAGAVWNPAFRIDQKAATLWYHPHLMGKTAEHVYRGLAGMFIIDDPYADSLPIPREYGVNDIPLILQDRRFAEDGSFSYAPAMPDVMHGYLGNAILVNGAFRPQLERPAGTYRFRLLNGSNSSIIRVSLSDRREFTVIASDGGFLPESVSAEAIVLSPGERFEILIDLAPATEVSLVTEVYGGDTFEVMDIKADGDDGRYYDHPASFDYDPVTVPEDPTTRDFLMETRGMAGFSINGRRMDMNVIDFTLPKDSTEVWRVVNVPMGMMNVPHSFHVHDVQFTVLSVNGAPPPPLYRGPKDTVLLFPGDEIVFALRFEDYTGIYMYHCHLLEHEDAGMMGQFLIE